MATLAQKLAREGVGLALARTGVFYDLTVTAVANTDYVVPVPAGAQHLKFRTITTTGFGAATDAQISIGKTVGGAEYVAATTVKAVGVKDHTLVDAQAADYVNLPQAYVNVRIAQSGAASATGAARLFVEYSLPA